MDLPSGVMKALDVDAAYDFEGTNQIYIIGDDGNLYTRARVNKEPRFGLEILGKVDHQRGLSQSHRIA